ncbi:MAG TPA: lipoprotein [Burkholderiaceae bacterium]|jgi:predicted small lipoprotein YifL|nr:lipoprotein [Burkholderiaceae bacterium]
MKLRATILVGSLLAAVLAGCGHKGPLHLPGSPPSAAWPQPQPTPPAKPAERKPADVPAASDQSR